MLNAPATPARPPPSGLEPLHLDGPAFRESAARNLKHRTEFTRTIASKVD